MIPPLLQLVLFVAIALLAVCALILAVAALGGVDGHGRAVGADRKRLSQVAQRLGAIERWRDEFEGRAPTRGRPGTLLPPRESQGPPS